MWTCALEMLPVFLPISALEYEKYNLMSTSFCIQYSDGTKEYCELLARTLGNTIEKKNNS